MRRIGLLISSLVCAGLMLAATGAQACPETPSCGCQKKAEATQTAASKPEDKSAQPETSSVDPASTPACPCGGSCAKAAKKKVEPKAEKQGMLVRPHHALDASAGVMG